MDRPTIDCKNLLITTWEGGGTVSASRRRRRRPTRCYSRNRGAACDARRGCRYGRKMLTITTTIRSSEESQRKMSMVRGINSALNTPL